MKNIHSILAVFLFTASVFLTHKVSAQAPQKMSYQSVIRNSSNVLVANTQVGLQISVLQGSASGTAVYVESQAATTNANGLVSLQIGSGNATAGTFSGIDWASGPYFIQTEIDPTGGSNYAITGTQEILSVPFALYAAKSGNSTTMGPIGGSSTANGGTIESGVLSLTPADRNNGGVVTYGTQDFDGNKSFYGDMNIYNTGNSGSKVRIYNNNNTFTNPIGTNLNIEGYLSYAGIQAGNYPLYSTADINPGLPDYNANPTVTFDNLTALHLTSPENYFDNNTSNWWALLTDGDVKVNGKVNTSGTYTGAGFKTPNGQATEYLMADGSVSTGATGTQGPQGELGPIGEKGDKGDKGDVGMPGPAGSDAFSVFEPTVDMQDAIYNTNTGNVGIGTDLPSEKLDVNGNIRVRGIVGIGTQEPNTSAALEINSSTGALLIPRMTTEERNNLNASEGMIIYNTTDASYQGFSNAFIYADPIVDQAQGEIDNGFGPNDKSQSFTAGISGALSSVKVLLNCLDGPQTATIYIRDGAGNSGAILYQSTIMINYNDGGNWVTIQPSGVTVIAGHVYSINIVNQGGFGPFSRIDWLCRIDQDNYSGGNLFFGGDAFGGDGVFETTVTPPPSASLQWIRLNPAQTEASSTATTMGFIAGSSTIKGGSIDENGVLSLAPADAVNGGIVTTGNQNFAGNKSFNGYVGIGTNNPAALLNVVGGDRQTGVRVEGGNASIALASSREYQIYARSEGDLVFYDQTADEAGDPSAFRMMINSAGKVGVNNANPMEQLDVAGNIKSSANMLANSFVKAGGTSSQFLMADGSVSEGILEVVTTMQAQIAGLQAQIAGLIPPTLSTVVIGTQTWTSTNLNVTTYRNGDAIPEVQDGEEWANLTTGAWCHLNNDPANDAIYGKIYNHYAIEDTRGLAPVGYHIPSFAEYTTLINTIPIGTTCQNTSWYNAPALMSSSFYGGTNTTGFSALNGGFRSGDAIELIPGFPGNQAAGQFNTSGTSFWASDAEGSYNYIYLAEQCAIGSTDSASNRGAYIRLIKN